MLDDKPQIIAELQKKVEELSVFNEIGKALTSTLDLRKVLDVIMEKISELFKPKNWSLLLIDEHTNDLYFEIAIGAGAEELNGLRLKLGEGVAGWVAQHGEPLLISDAYSDPRFTPVADEKTRLKTQSIIAVPLKSKGKVLGVIEIINQMAGRSFRIEDLTLLKTMADYAAIAIENARYFRRVQELTVKDDMTDLYNSRFLQQQLDLELHRSRRYRLQFSLVFFDLDHFKLVNDKYGHLVGSQVLRETADIVREHLREVDVPTRYGGDEFVLLLPETTSVEARVVTERIRDAINAHIYAESEGHNIRLTASFGIATFPEDADNKLDIVRMSDNAMYRVKETTRNGIECAGNLVKTQRPV
jgi:diguanylate cyclase (GGDEF)-like protein